jgi:hypothetical protein
MTRPVSKKPSTAPSRRFGAPCVNNTLPEFDEGEGAGSGIQLTLDAVMLYEDLSTGLRGKGVLECAAQLFPGSPHFNLAIWRFDVLRAAIVRELALHKASVADVVVLSAHGHKALPKAVKLWLKQWLGQKDDEPCALMVSLNDDSRDSASASQIISSLQAEANARNVVMFPHFSKTPCSEGVPSAQTIQRPAPAHKTRLDENWRWPELQSHWGINE